jgi:hypothetical protein
MGLGFDGLLDFGVLRCGMNYGRVATGESLVPNDASRSRGGWPCLECDATC